MNSLKRTWNPVVEKCRIKLNSWKAKFLSKGGRLTLINSVLRNLPTYFMSVFRMPRSIVQKIESLQRSFFWNGSSNSKKIHDVNWDTLCAPKRQGGLGIGSVDHKNVAMLSKWIWRFSRPGSSLWKRALIGKYEMNVNQLVMSFNPSVKRSPFAKTIQEISRSPKYAEVISNGFVLSVGKGNCIDFWNNIWCSEAPLKISFPRIFALSRIKEGPICIFGNWEVDNWCCDVQYRRRLFDWEIEQQNEFKFRLSSQRIVSNVPDGLCWRFDDRGVFYVRSFCDQLARSQSSHLNSWHKVWHPTIPPKTSILVWQTLHGRLTTKNRIASLCQVGDVDSVCVLCGEREEDTDHLMLSCKFSWGLWCSVLMWWNLSAVVPNSFVVWWRH